MPLLSFNVQNKNRSLQYNTDLGVGGGDVERIIRTKLAILKPLRYLVFVLQEDKGRKVGGRSWVRGGLSNGDSTSCQVLGRDLSYRPFHLKVRGKFLARTGRDARGPFPPPSYHRFLQNRPLLGCSDRQRLPEQGGGRCKALEKNEKNAAEKVKISSEQQR